MALTPSVIPLAQPGVAGPAAPEGVVAADGTVSPGGFLGLLGALAAPPASLAPASAPALTDLATTALATAMTTAAANSGADAQLAALVEPPASDSAPVDLATTPEAAAAAMAVMAQMLAGTQSVPAQIAAPTLVPAVAPPAASSTAADLAAAPVTPTAPGLRANTDPLSLAGTVTTDAAALAPQAASIPLAPLLPRPAGAKAVSVPSMTARTAVTLEIPDALAPPVAEVGKTAGFQSLAALLSDAKGPAGASAQTAPDGSRLAAMSTLAMPGLAGDAATGDAQQPVLIREPVGTAQWADSIGARLTVMATRGEQQGSLRLSPEHLGPVEVQIRTQDDKASVWFGAHHAETRAALQDALPRLRELFAAQGMQLGDAGVSRDPPRQGPVPSRAPTNGSGAGTDPSGVPERIVALTPAGPDRHPGLLDTYA